MNKENEIILEAYNKMYKKQKVNEDTLPDINRYEKVDTPVFYRKNGIELIAIDTQEEFNEYIAPWLKNVSFDELKKITDYSIYMVKNSRKNLNMLSIMLKDDEGGSMLIDDKGNKIIDNDNIKEYKKLLRSVIDNKEALAYLYEVGEAEVNFRY